MVSRALDEDAPAFPGGRDDLVDLERHLVLGVGDAGAQVLTHRAVLPGPEHDRLFIQREVDRQDGGPEPARVADPPHTARRDEPQALCLIQELHDCSGRALDISLIGHVALSFVQSVPSIGIVSSTSETGRRGVCGTGSP